MKNKIEEVRIVLAYDHFVVTFTRTKGEHTYTLTYNSGGEVVYKLGKLCNILVVEVTFTGLAIHYEPKPARKEFFNVLRVSRDDFEEQGYDASKLSDSDMQEIANFLGENESSMEGFWESIDFAAELFDVPKISQANRVDEEREKIKQLYEESSIRSNLEPCTALLIYNVARERELTWYTENYDMLDDEKSIMPDSFYLDVVPLIKSRAAAARRGQE